MLTKVEFTFEYEKQEKIYYVFFSLYFIDKLNTHSFVRLFKKKKPKNIDVPTKLNEWQWNEKKNHT